MAKNIAKLLGKASKACKGKKGKAFHTCRSNYIAKRK